MAYSTITKPSLYFNTKLYSGTGSAQNITGVGFQPDFTWIKDRTNANSHMWVDAVRGATKVLASDATYAETTDANRVSAFTADGFNVGTNNNVNQSGANVCSWNWKANGQGSANTDGSINTTYTSVNTTSGISICKWSGSGSNATIGHGLGVVPQMIITKSMASSSWCVYHEALGNTKTIFLESNGVGNTHIAYYNNTSPTSSVFTVGTDDAVNHSGNDMIAYCFANVKGYSKFGSYTGNDNADGTFVYTGFKPAWIIRKNIDGGVTESWFMEDNKRNTFNPANEWLAADASSAEGANNFDTDFLSNGFKMRSNNHGTNKGSTNYIYMAFAEEPLVANVGASIPATAR